MRKKIIAGNWKMNTTLDEGLKLASEVVHMAEDGLLSDTTVIMSVPYTHLQSIKKIIGSATNVLIAAQNCHQEVSGAYTGEISAAKTRIVLAHQMVPIFCCGEKLAIREENAHFDLVKEQLSSSLFQLDAADFAKIIIAYEPVWAIGTGVTASDEQAQEMHHFIRETIAEKYGESIASQLPILYGGSVKPANAQTLFSCPDVDGGLIGGASLDAQGFIDIARSF